MKKSILSLILVLAFGLSGWNVVDASDEHGTHGSKSGQETMDHGSMDHSSMGSTFSHEADLDKIRAEFQVMTLESMKMKDPEGNSHHVMVKFFDKATKEQLKKAVGRIKVIGPKGKEQVVDLKSYSGIFAANFSAEKKGKYGIICLFKIGGEKHLAKFWYHQ